MEKHINQGYQLPTELIEVMDLASQLNAKMNEVGVLEQHRIINDGWCSADGLRFFMEHYNNACECVGNLMTELSNYAREYIMTEMFDKNQ